MTSPFTAPTLEQVRDYCRQRKNSVDPQLWLDHYESNGWMVGKVRMKNWQAAVRTWERMNFQNGHSDGDQAAESFKRRVARVEAETIDRRKAAADMEFRRQELAEQLKKLDTPAGR